MSISTAASAPAGRQQEEALRMALDWYGDADQQEFYLAGYAGTGKTTLAQLIIKEIQERYPRRCKKVISGAFMAKAADVLRQKGAPDPMTIHSMIYKAAEDPLTGKFVFTRAPDTPIASADLVVLDEISMVNDEMAADTRSYGKKCLILGDPGQLQPIRGTGAFVNRKPDYFLTEPHRHALDSPILQLATLAREGKRIQPGIYSHQVKVVVLDNSNFRAVLNRDTQVLCGVHRSRHAITKMIRQDLGFAAPYPQAGERVICRRNNRDEGIFNGQLGYAVADAIEDHDSDWRSAEFVYQLSVRMDGRDYNQTDLPVHPYLFQQHFQQGIPKPQRIDRGLNEFDWGSALTVHSSIGSQWRHVTLVDDSGAFREDRASHLYTGITRAETDLYLMLRAA